MQVSLFVWLGTLGARKIACLMTKKFCSSLLPVMGCSLLMACGGEDDTDVPGAVGVAAAPGDQTATGGAGLSAAAIRGGALYDRHWVVTGGPEPTTTHPLWASRPDMVTNTRTGSSTWRCKECHGWDYKGVNGAYSTGSHLTGIRGIFGTAMTAEQLPAFLSDPNGHAYDLAPADLQALAEFVTTGQMDTDTVITDGAFVGDAAAGQALYDGACTVCHDADGLNTMPLGSAGGFEDFPGAVATDNAVEYLHKVRFGQPGTAMPPQAGILTPEQLGALGSYSSTLPVAP